MARRKTPETAPPAEAPAVPVEAPVQATVADAQPAPDSADPRTDPPPAQEAETGLLSDPEPQALPRDPEPLRPRRSGVLGPVLGGALAALAGFGLSHFNLFGLAPPDASAALGAFDQRLTESLAAARTDQEALSALRSDLAALADRVSALEAAPAPQAPDLSALDDLARRLSAIEALPTGGGEASTAALAAQLAALERRLAAQPPGVDQAEMQAALDRLAAAEAEAEARATEAAAAADAAARAEALDALRTAAAAGAAFQDELSALADPDLTAALSPHAGGVATLAALQSDFPDAARQTLALARDAAGGGTWTDRLTDFLAAQTGARSLEPRAGDDPDAILSRAEFALSEARIADALAELGALDDAIRAPFADWIARAEARLAVDTALEGR